MAARQGAGRSEREDVLSSSSLFGGRPSVPASNAIETTHPARVLQDVDEVAVHQALGRVLAGDLERELGGARARARRRRLDRHGERLHGRAARAHGHGADALRPHWPGDGHAAALRQHGVFCCGLGACLPCRVCLVSFLSAFFCEVWCVLCSWVAPSMGVRWGRSMR
jgi:hypothetical protein